MSQTASSSRHLLQRTNFCHQHDEGCLDQRRRSDVSSECEKEFHGLQFGTES